MQKSVKAKPIYILISVMMMLSILSPCLSVAAAQEDEIQPMAAVIDSYSLGISISGITAKCNAHLVSSYSTSLKIKMEIQKKKSSGYETVETWTSTKTGVAMTMSESRAINLLSDYRLKVTFTAGGETKIDYAYPS